jgi:hypothetical protein
MRSSRCTTALTCVIIRRARATRYRSNRSPSIAAARSWFSEIAPSSVRAARSNRVRCAPCASASRALISANRVCCLFSAASISPSIVRACLACWRSACSARQAATPTNRSRTGVGRTRAIPRSTANTAFPVARDGPLNVSTVSRCLPPARTITLRIDRRGSTRRPLTNPNPNPPCQNTYWFAVFDHTPLS